MKTNTLKKVLSVATSLSLALAFTFATSVKVDALSGPCAEQMSCDSGNLVSQGTSIGTLSAGEEAFLSNIKVDGQYTVYNFNVAGGSGRFLATATNAATPFKMFIEENGKLVNEGTFTGAGQLAFEPRSYKSARFGVKNTAQGSDTFCGQIELCNAGSFTPEQVKSGASRILAPIAALLGGLLFLF